jgi:AraC-like DNA-binding protein
MTQRDGTLVIAIERVIRERLSDALNVATLSSALGLSRSHFSRAFHKAAGQSPRAYIVRLRVECAMKLMNDGDLSLSQIALAAGFADQAHFSNVFRRATGESPSQWRRLRADD